MRKHRRWNRARPRQRTRVGHAWKVCSTVCEEYTSSIVSDPTLRVSYAIGKVSRPTADNTIGLFAFDNRAAAIAHARLTSRHTAILVCDAGNPRRVRRVLSGWFIELCARENVWPPDCTMAPPAGTVVCDWIRPTGVLDICEWGSEGDYHVYAD